MKITKRQLRRIIKEEKTKLLSEMTPGDIGIAAAGGGTPADRGFAAAKMDADAINREQDRLEDERILQEFISDLEELVMTALQNEVPEHEASKQLMMLGRSLRNR